MVVVINCFDMIDKVLFCLGRIDRILYVFFLDLEVRKEIFKIYFFNIFVGDDVGIEEFVERMEMFLGVEIFVFCWEVVLVVLEENIEFIEVFRWYFDVVFVVVKLRIFLNLIELYWKY